MPELRSGLVTAALANIAVARLAAAGVMRWECAAQSRLSSYQSTSTKMSFRTGLAPSAGRLRPPREPSTSSPSLMPSPSVSLLLGEVPVLVLLT